MTPADVPTVIIVDDDDLVRASIQGMLKSVGLRSEAFATPQEFLQSKRSDGPNCLILDVQLPGLSGLDFQQALADAGFQIPIIFVTGYGDIPMSVKAMKSGAVEFLTKPFREEDLLDAIQQALDRDRARRKQQGLTAELRSRHGSLTAREREVTQLLAEGKSSKEVASLLNLSTKTVETHRSNIMRKLSLHSIRDLVVYAIKNNIIQIQMPPQIQRPTETTVA